MFKITTLDFKSSRTLGSLVFDYLDKNEVLRPFYNAFPDEDGFRRLLEERPYGTLDRDLLSDILLQQSLEVKNTSESSTANLQRLKQPNCYTVTTGHQLCLFTGPLFFIYKVFSVINLAESLKKRFPGHDFVPVYWMATEDHDFEEVNHFHARGRTITWTSHQQGPVGEFLTEELQALLPEIQALFGRSENADYLVSLFSRAYLEHKTLSEATRFLVNELFGEYGLVTVDGNDQRFKEQFRTEFRKDLFGHQPQDLVQQSIQALEKAGYSTQVNPRQINCFYHDKGLRARIEKRGEHYELVGTKTLLSQQDLEQILEQQPWRISPNVVLRPAYQQKILPNLAYTGGPGELAYWLELKHMFDELGLLFPILMPRNFVTVVDKVTENRVHKLNFSIPDFYKPEEELIRELQVKEDAVFDLSPEKASITEFYSKILEKASAADQTLSGSVSAELQRALKGFERITGKTNRALRRRYETEISQIRGVKQRLFPARIPQERYENFSSFYLQYGPGFLEEIRKHADPFLYRHIILTETQD